MQYDGNYFILSMYTIVYIVLDLHHRQRRNRSKKTDERDETMGFSAMDENLIKSSYLWICNDLFLYKTSKTFGHLRKCQNV